MELKFKDIKKIWKRIWYFIWEENSVWSWIVNIILAFILIKFIVFPIMGLLVGTTHPIVAVVSASMEHHENFDEWWEHRSDYYSDYGVTKEDFKSFKLRNGFNRGDIIFLRGAQPDNIRVGDVIVFKGPITDPIIHRVMKVWKEDGEYLFRTKGDANDDSNLYETRISKSQIIGKALVRVPLFGYVKIFFVDELCPLPGIKQTGQFLGICPKV